jgi:hypothetical protein
MTGLVEPTTTDEQSEPGDVHDATEPIPDTIRARRDGGWFAAIDGWRGVGRLACGAAGALAIAWFILLSPGETGSKADWFFGAVVFVVAVVAMWQTVNVQRQADRRVAEAAERLRIELAAAEKRSARELELTQRLHEAQLELHRAEMESRQKAHRAEMDAAHQQARVDRSHLVNQLQKQAVTEVSRAIAANTQMLATLWNRGASILHSGDRDEREQSMLPIFEQIGQVVNDFSVELANAHQIVEDERLNQALEGVNEAVLMAIRVAQEVCDDVVAGRAPETNPIPQVQRLMQERAADARRLAWDLLRAGLDDQMPMPSAGSLPRSSTGSPSRDRHPSRQGRRS